MTLIHLNNILHNFYPSLISRQIMYRDAGSWKKLGVPVHFKESIRAWILCYCSALLRIMKYQKGWGPAVLKGVQNLPFPPGWTRVNWSAQNWDPSSGVPEYSMAKMCLVQITKFVHTYINQVKSVRKTNELQQRLQFQNPFFKFSQWVKCIAYHLLLLGL